MMAVICTIIFAKKKINLIEQKLYYFSHRLVGKVKGTCFRHVSMSARCHKFQNISMAFLIKGHLENPFLKLFWHFTFYCIFELFTMSGVQCMFEKFYAQK